MRSSFFVLSCLILTLCCLYAEQAQAKIKDTDYQEASLLNLTEFSVHYKTIDLKNPELFKEYLKLSECAVSAEISNSPFKLQEAQQRFITALTAKQMQDRELYVRVPIKFRISGYNFDTQSFPIYKQDHLVKVNMLELSPSAARICNNETSDVLRNLPTFYYAKLNFPVSMYRIPIQQDIAENIAGKLDVYETYNVIYGYVLLQIEGIQPEKTGEGYRSTITVRGSVNAIDLYIDSNRKILFKRLDYEENY